MKDRISASPGRVLITPESGAAFYATMTRADNPTQEGDSLSKNTLLKDSTAEALGLSDAALPDDALRILSRLHAGLGNEYLWAKTANQLVVDFGSEVAIAVTTDEIISYSDKYEITADGILQLVNPSTTTMGYAENPILHGKYVHFSTDSSSNGSPKGEFFGLCTATYTIQQTISDLTIKPMTARESGDFGGYVNSPDPNAYPPAEDDGYTYQALGMLGDKVRIATGSYTGTGENSKTLTFEHLPKMVVITDTVGPKTPFIAIQGDQTAIQNNASTKVSVNVAWSGNSITMSSTNAPNALNNSGSVYRYIALF